VATNVVDIIQTVDVLIGIAERANVRLCLAPSLPNDVPKIVHKIVA